MEGSPHSAKPRRPGRPRLPAKEQRERLIAAADRILLRTDPASGSVKEIVREAGMSSRSFYDHFRSKDEVLIELVERRSQSFFAGLGEVLTPQDRTAQERIDAGLGVYFATLAPVVALDRKPLGDATRERVEAYRAQGLNQLLDMVMPALVKLRAAGVISRLPKRPAVELVLLGIEGLTERHVREGRSEQLSDLRPVMRDQLLALV
ncbi:MAG: TetR/AcrR family transcriptional regulator, partial [bacterium]|nr:TetR/AcrR family transcriptional regulator [bacterium]